MRDAVGVPVTVKSRIGIDEQDTEAPLDRFADLMVAAGADAIYVHARKAWLRGLSPKENRSVPPLDYGRVHRLAARLAPFPVMINGGIQTLVEAERHLALTAGVMLGRAAYYTPMMLAEVDAKVFGEAPRAVTLAGIVTEMAAYAESQLSRGVRLNSITRHMLGLAAGQPGARTYRQILSVDAARPGAGPETMLRALAAVSEAREREPELAF
jgi:tRNA-dihydrouridine synthase A